MTKEQLATVKLGDYVTLRKQRGKVTRCAGSWFMVTWEHGDTPEIFSRTPTIFSQRLELELC